MALVGHERPRDLVTSVSDLQAFGPYCQPCQKKRAAGQPLKRKITGGDDETLSPFSLPPLPSFNLPPIFAQSQAPAPHCESNRVIQVQSRPKPQCWEHGCNGRQFSTFSNLLRHQREKSGQADKATCPDCGTEFTRTTARNGHLLHQKCRQTRTELDDVCRPQGQSGEVPGQIEREHHGSVSKSSTPQPLIMPSGYPIYPSFPSGLEKPSSSTDDEASIALLPTSPHSVSTATRLLSAD